MRPRSSLLLRRAADQRGAVFTELVIVVPSDDTQRVQESHIAMLHALCDETERVLFPERG